MKLVDPKWTCEVCNRTMPVPLTSRGPEGTRVKLKKSCALRGHKCKPYYTAGVKL